MIKPDFPFLKHPGEMFSNANNSDVLIPITDIMIIILIPTIFTEMKSKRGSLPIIKEKGR